MKQKKLEDLDWCKLPLHWIQQQDGKIKVVSMSEQYVHLRCDGGDIYHRIE